MESSKIRSTFLQFFKEKQHEIVESSLMVMKDDPTLLFTNAGMNQFKDFFLGNRKPEHIRMADTQKCLRVSGKHNDLEEVGVDTYHHTMFEMLGNWSFGDYFKTETIDWAYELLVDKYGINKDLLYVTYFNGDDKDKLSSDDETRKLWGKYFSEDRILGYGKRDNFWEMGETGPCGPCSEIHIDLRSDEEKQKISGRELVNASHPLVIEIWNLVFIEFNRNKDQSLNELPKKHVDTGMGLERLAMVLQGKKSNYDTDLFMVLINGLEQVVGKKYGHSSGSADVAFRVIVDHVRAVSISIAEGQLPSNTGAGYVIRRILRRAIRYGYSFLDVREPVIQSLVPYLVQSLGLVFRELVAQEELIQKVIREEEEGFLRTLAKGIERFEKYLSSNSNLDEIDGHFAFELYDTYGFPVDLTELMAAENGISKGVNKADFEKNLQEQKNRSRSAGKIDADDWTVLKKDDVEEFVGYDNTEVDVIISKYRKIQQKGKTFFQLVFNITPFYAESGGQVGDVGMLKSDSEQIKIVDTKKENELIVHLSDKLPADPTVRFKAVVDLEKRERTMKNHSATHLLHHALREVLGEHVEQKGSLVHPDYLRFDFSHFERVSPEDLKKVELLVKKRISKGIDLDENRSMPISRAKEMGAMALFGEKYGDLVRVIKFGESVELCGGTHVSNTAEIGSFKIMSEGSISAGIRRIEAISGPVADAYISEQLDILDSVKDMLKQPADVKVSLQKLLSEHQKLQKELESLNKEKAGDASKKLEGEIEDKGDVKILCASVNLTSDDMRSVIFKLTGKHRNLVVALSSVQNDKVLLSIGVGDDAISAKQLSAKKLIVDVAPIIQGGGGGQDKFATAGGKNVSGIDEAFDKIREIVSG